VKRGGVVAGEGVCCCQTDERNRLASFIWEQWLRELFLCKKNQFNSWVDIVVIITTIINADGTGNCISSTSKPPVDPQNFDLRLTKLISWNYCVCTSRFISHDILNCSDFINLPSYVMKTFVLKLRHYVALQEWLWSDLRLVSPFHACFYPFSRDGLRLEARLVSVRYKMPLCSKNCSLGVVGGKFHIILCLLDHASLW